MNDREWLKKLIVLAERLRRTPIVDNDFPEMRNNFDHALDDAAIHLAKSRPTVVCLCGSTRFFQQFQEANYRETMAGRIVLSVGFYPHSSEQAHGQSIGCDDSQKLALDTLHMRKIDECDEVLVLNVGGYVGSSTRNEINYAKANNKRIRYLEPAE